MLDVLVGYVFGCTSSCRDIFFWYLGFWKSWETGLDVGAERIGEKKKSGCPNLLNAIGAAPKLGRGFLFLVVKVESCSLPLWPLKLKTGLAHDCAD